MIRHEQIAVNRPGYMSARLELAAPILEALSRRE
jgi:hypothetical protein